MNKSSFHERMVSKEMRHAYQLIYSIEMITRIPTAYNETIDAAQALHAATMIDAFYVHLRLMGDFLVKGTKEDKDFGPTDFDVPWDVQRVRQSDAAKRLLDHWNTASKYVVHFGHDRVPDQVEDLQVFEVNARSMASMATDALTVLAAFIRAVEVKSSENEVEIAAGDATALSERARLLIERARVLQQAFDTACGRLGLDPASRQSTAHYQGPSAASAERQWDGSSD